MRRHYSTEQFEVFKQEAREDFLGQVRWSTQHALQQMLEADSEQQMADYLGRRPYERNGEPAGADRQPQWLLRAGLRNPAGSRFACEFGAPASVRSCPAESKRCSGAHRKSPR